MCLITTTRKVKIAKRDIIVWKIMVEESDKVLYSPYQGFRYVKGRKYKAKITETKDYQWRCFDDTDEDWLLEHYPNWTDRAKIDSNYDGKLMCFQKGFHSALNKKRLTHINECNDYTTVKCIIPKGSEYYKDTTGCIVSNQIKVIG